VTEDELQAIERGFTDGEPYISLEAREYIADAQRLLTEVRRLQAGDLVRQETSLEQQLVIVRQRQRLAALESRNVALERENAQLRAYLPYLPLPDHAPRYEAVYILVECAECPAAGTALCEYDVAACCTLLTDLLP
jgi:BMFP domain-containing protein YqiC